MLNLMNKKTFLLPALLLCLLFPKHSMAQFYSVRTNLVGMATGNLNVEGSMAFSTRWTAHLPVQYNPFNLWSDAKLKNFTVEPGVRYWMRESYGGGYFFGIHGVFSIYNRSEEHTSELQSRQYLVCRLLLEKKKKNIST